MSNKKEEPKIKPVNAVRTFENQNLKKFMGKKEVSQAEADTSIDRILQEIAVIAFQAVPQKYSKSDKRSTQMLKLKALEMLGRFRGMFLDKTKFEATGNITVTVDTGISRTPNEPVKK